MILKGSLEKKGYKNNQVSILVLMEYDLKESWQTARFLLFIVSILVLMEYDLKAIDEAASNIA